VSTGRRFPPVIELATVALGLIVVGGIVMAASAPRRPDLTLPLILLLASAALFLTAVVMLLRVDGFGWAMFAKVYPWALLAYVVSAGMIEFAFVKNHTRGAPLAVVTGMLLIFATVVPFLIATTVGRYVSQPVATARPADAT
jgi:hypothetical protein